MPEGGCWCAVERLGDCCNAGWMRHDMQLQEAVYSCQGNFMPAGYEVSRPFLMPLI